jgi:hypothetical protein
MAMLISRATGNFTSSSTWGVADSATNSQLTNPSASTNTTTSYVYSSTFTGTNTSVADGIVLFLKRLNTTGTVTVALSDDNGVTATRSVTVNASDLPADESWVFFKFGTTLTLDGGTDYRVGVIASSADNALIYRDSTAGNWARMVSTTLTGAPAAGDTMLIVGELTGAGASSSYTVTMDNTTTTDFGTDVITSKPSQTNPRQYNGLQIGQNGTLTWGTSAATNYYLKLSGHLMVWADGTYNMGTSGTPCPRDSTMFLEMDSQGIHDTNAYGFCVFNDSSVSIYGQSRTAGKNVSQCKLSADAAIGATSLTVDVDTGWLDNDEIAVAVTSTATNQVEFGTLNGNAGASTLTVDGFTGTAGGLAFAHTGTAPTQGEIVLLTRNVTISVSLVSSGTKQYYLFINSASSFEAQWCRFVNWSSASGSANSTVSSNTPINFRNCAFNFYPSSPNASVLVYASNGGTITDCSFTRAGVSLSVATHPCTITNNYILSGNVTVAFFPTTVFTGNSISAASTGLTITGLASASVTVGGNTIHSCATGIGFTDVTAPAPGNIVTVNNFLVWRCVNNCINAQRTQPVIVNNLTSFGHVTSHIVASTGAALFTFNNCIFAGETSFPTQIGLNISSYIVGSQYIFNNCDFSPTSGIYVPNTVADINLTSASTRPMITLNNTLLGAATEVASPQNLSISGFIKSSKHDKTEGAFKSWFSGGVIERDSILFNTAAPSERLTPTSATIKLASGSRLGVLDDTTTKTISVYVRKSATGDGAQYNGNQPRLIVKANPAMGVNTDTVLDTMTAAVGTWEQLTATTPAVNADGALEFYVDCDGTAGWVNVDDWSIT